jgi:hypothetical protein
MRAPLLAVCAIAFLPALSLAQTSPSLVDEDRYHIVELADGVMRIDRQTGQVTECRPEASGLVCRLAADDRTAYEAEINRLSEALADARAALEAGEQALAPQEDLPGVRERMGLPSDTELDAVMDTAEEAMRRFMGMVENLRRENEALRGE